MLDLVDPDRLPLLGAVATGALSTAASCAPAAKAPSARNGVSVSAGRASFDALAREWRALDATAANPSLFQSYAWCRAVIDHHEIHGRAFKPRVLTLRKDDRLVGILPLRIVRLGLARIATGFGEPYQQYTDVLLAPDAPADAAKRLLDAACNLAGVDGLHLLKVRDDSPLALLLAVRGATRGNADAAPFVDLAPFADFRAYHATVNAKTRKNMRNARNRLSRSGTLAHRVLTDPGEIATLVARAHRGRERWLEELGLTSRAFRDPTFGAFANAIARNGTADGIKVMAMSLTVDDRPIADQWGFIFNDRYYAYVATWDPEFEESSPGKLHLEEVIHACKDEGVAVADFLMPAVAYKFTWAKEAVPVADYTLPLALPGRLVFSLWAAHIRPLLKRIALKLPTGIRSRAARLLLRR